MAGLNETLAALAARRQWTPPVSGFVGGRLQETALSGDNPGDLRMLVHAPDDLPQRPGLVVVLHGCTQTAESYAEGAGWLTLADRFGFVVLCPEQKRGNNPNLCFNWFAPGDVARGAGEVASIHAMIRQAMLEHDVDPGRVFVTGLSAGGAMANAMLAVYPELFAGGAIIAGLPYGAASNVQEAFAAMNGGRRLAPAAWGGAVRRASSHNGPWPRVSIWQGEADATVRSGVADDLVSQWTEVHGVRDPALETTDIAGHRRTTWRSAKGEAVVELHRIDGMGHGAPLACAAPDGCGAPGPYMLEVGVSSSLEIAKSWGLVEAGRTTRRTEAVRPSAALAPWNADTSGRVNAEQIEPQPHVRGLDGLGRTAEANVGKVIADALRAAGLMK